MEDAETFCAFLMGWDGVFFVTTMSPGLGARGALVVGVTARASCGCVAVKNVQKREKS